jgi:hypothetical protein
MERWQSGNAPGCSSEAISREVQRFESSSFRQENKKEIGTAGRLGADLAS